MSVHRVGRVYGDSYLPGKKGFFAHLVLCLAQALVWLLQFLYKARHDEIIPESSTFHDHEFIHR